MCINCRTERVPAALGAEILLDDADLERLDDDQDDISSIFPIEPRFVGRAHTLDRLVSVVDSSFQKSELAFVALTGPAGMGKSRLVDELRRRITAAHPRSLSLIAHAGVGAGAPYFAIQRILSLRFGIFDGDAAEIARQKILHGVKERLPASRVTEVAHLLAQLLGVPFSDSPIVVPLSEAPAQLEVRTFIALKRFLEADSRVRPLLIVVDEVERAQPETVNLIHYLAAGLQNTPVTLLVSGRPSLFDVHSTFGDGDVALERVEIAPLEAEESATLMRELLAPIGRAPEELIEHARTKMDGVPRAIVELVRLFLEVGAIVDDRGAETWRLDHEAVSRITLPTELEQILAERLRALESSERDLLEKAAACGEIFWVDCVVALVRAVALDRGDPDGPTLGEVAAAGDGTRIEVETAFRRLERRGLVISHPTSSIPGEREYRFAYPPWWDVVYEGIDADARRRYHRMLAQWLELRPEGRGEEEQEEIGRHLERAGDGDGAALRYRRAGDAARARYYNDKAVRLYVSALGCLGPGDLAGRIHLWHDLGSVFQLKGDFDSALGAYERMLRLAWVVASRTKAAVAFNKMGRIYRQKGELPIALEYLDRGRELFEQAGDVRGIAGSLDDVGQVLWLMSRYDEALDRSAAALETRRRLGDKRSIALSLLTIGHIERHRGLFDEAESCYQEALEIRRALDDKSGIAEALNGIGVLAFQRGDVDRARKTWQEALAIAESIGALPLQALLLSHLGETARSAGNPKEARTRFEEAEIIARDIDDKRLQSEALRNLGLLDLIEGNTQSALERCKLALKIAEGAGIRVDVGRALIALGEVEGSSLFGETGRDAERAANYFNEGVMLFREIGNDAELGVSLERFGKYCVERGDVQKGKQLLTEAQSIFNRLGMKAGDAVRRVIGEL